MRRTIQEIFNFDQVSANFYQVSANETPMICDWRAITHGEQRDLSKLEIRRDCELPSNRIILCAFVVG